MQFDQDSRLAILLNIFWFSAKILKTDLKPAFRKFVELIETNPLIYNTLQLDQYPLMYNMKYFRMEMKSRYTFEDRSTDRQTRWTESISECTLKDLSNDSYMKRLSKLKIS